MTGLVLLDSDVARKLCQYQLLPELALALSCTLSDFAILPQLKFQLRLATAEAAIKKLGSEAAFAQAKSLVENAQVVEIRLEYLNRLLVLNRPDIESGEAVLFAALVQHQDARMLSGDKRAFVALSKIGGEPLLAPIWIRCICLEEAIWLILHSGRFEEISTKVRARPDVDSAICSSFGRSAAASKTSVINALSSYMHDLVKETGERYVPSVEKASVAPAAKLHSN